METKLKQVVRKWHQNQNRAIGVLVANKIFVVDGIKDKEAVVVSWAKCNTKLEPFDKENGFAIANDRLDQYLERKMVNEPEWDVPQSIKPNIELFVKRCQRYFKTDDVRVFKMPLNKKPIGFWKKLVSKFI